MSDPKETWDGNKDSFGIPGWCDRCNRFGRFKKGKMPRTFTCEPCMAELVRLDSMESNLRALTRRVKKLEEVQKAQV